MIPKKLFTLVTATASLSLFGASFTRTVPVPEPNEDGQIVATFAVPNGCTFVGATIADGEVESGSPTVVNGVSVVPVLVNSGSGDITVTFEDGAQFWTGFPAKIMREYLKSVVANPEDVPTTRYTPPVKGRSTLSVLPTHTSALEGIDYLLLSPPALVDEWTAYINARKAVHPGVKFKLVNLADVYREYPWTANATDGTPRNPAESIHKFLRDEARDYGVSYVVLGGAWIDAQRLDENGVWHHKDNGRPVRFENGDEMSLTNCVPGVYATPHAACGVVNADTFYACLDLYPGDAEYTQKYPWTSPSTPNDYFKLSGNGKYFDNGPDVVVARMAFMPKKNQTIAQLITSYIAKLARGENSNFPGQGRIGLNYDQFGRQQVGVAIGSSSMHHTEYEFYDDIVNEFAENRGGIYYVDTEPYVRRDSMRWISDYRPIWRTDGIGTYCNNINNYFAQDRDLGTVCGHGQANGSASFTSGNYLAATGLTLFCDATNPCFTGHMDCIDDVTSSEYNIIYRCLGSAAIGGLNGGALTSFNNTRESWTAGHNVDSFSDKMSHRICRAYGRENANAGLMWLSAHYEFFNRSTSDNNGFIASGNGTVEMMCAVEHVLYGDPLVRAQKPLYDAGTLGNNAAFPHLASNVTFTAGATILCDGDRPNAVMFAHAGDNVTLTTGNNSAASHKTKITHRLDVDGTTFTFAGAVEGGVGREGVCFTGANPGTLNIESTGRLYIAAVNNCREVVVSGQNAILDVDNFDMTKLTALRFTAPAGSTNIIRSIKTGALANIPVFVSGGGCLKLETDDVFGGTTVTLSDNSSVYVGVDPMLGKRLNSTEPLRANFVGNGTVWIPFGTSETKKWTLTGGVTSSNIGQLTTALVYNGTAGSTINSSWTSSLVNPFINKDTKLGPGGFVYVVSDKLPSSALSANMEGFSIAFYCDLTDVAYGDDISTVLLSLGTQATDGQQLLLTMNGAKRRIKLEITGNGGEGTTGGPSIRYPGDGYHLYLVRYSKEGGLRFSIDGSENPDVLPSEDSPDYATFDFEPNVTSVDTDINFKAMAFQIASQYGSLKNGRRAATKMAFAGIRGYDAILDEGSIAALCKELPVIPAAPELIMRSSASSDYAPTCTGKVVSATFPTGTFLGAQTGYLYVEPDAVVQVPALRFQDGASLHLRGVDIYGSVILTQESDELDVYAEQNAAMSNPDENGERMAGIIMGANCPNKSATSLNTSYGLMNVYGLLDGSKSYFEINRDGKSAEWVNIKGGVLKTKGIVDLSTVAKSQVEISKGGTLEVDNWPVDNGGEQRVTFKLNGGTVRMTPGTDETQCYRNFTVSGDNVFDVNGRDLNFTGSFAGSGLLYFADSSEGQTGSVSLPNLEGFTGMLKLDNSLNVNESSLPQNWTSKKTVNGYTVYNYTANELEELATITYTLNNVATNFTPNAYASYAPVTLPVPELGAYEVFSGWYTNAELTGTKLVETDSTMRGNLALYGTVTSELRTITYIIDGNNVSLTPNTFAYYEPVTLPRPALGEYQSFSGWYTTEGLSGDPIAVTDANMRENLTLYGRITTENVWLGTNGDSLNNENLWSSGKLPAAGETFRLAIAEGEAEVLVKATDGDWLRSITWQFSNNVVLELSGDSINVETWRTTGIKRLVIAEGATAVANSIPGDFAIEINGTYQLTVINDNLNYDNNANARDLSKITGNGTISLNSNGNYWFAPPKTGKMWASTLAIENNLATGLVMTDTTTNTIGSLSGSGKLRSDWGSGKRTVRIVQSRNTTWTGGLTGDNRIGGIVIAGPEEGESGTLTMPNVGVALTIESNGSVVVNGNGSGNVVNSGRYCGGGQLNGTLTFNEGSTYVAANNNTKLVSGAVSGNAKVELGFVPVSSQTYNLIQSVGSNVSGTYTLADQSLVDQGWSVNASGQNLTLSWSRPAWSVKVDGQPYQEQQGELQLPGGKTIEVNGTFNGWVTILSGGYDVTDLLKPPFSTKTQVTLTGTVKPELDPAKVSAPEISRADFTGDSPSFTLNSSVRGLYYVLESGCDLETLLNAPSIDDCKQSTTGGSVSLTPKCSDSSRFYRIRVGIVNETATP